MGAERQDSGGVLTSDIEGRIARWLTALLLETTGIEPPVDIGVSHAAVDQNRRMVRSYQVAALPVPAPDLYKLAADIGETIVADAEELGGLQRYQIIARSRGQEVGSTTVRWAMEVMPSAIDSEPATARGLVAQAQRHSEGAVRMLLQGNASLLSSFQRRLADQDAVIERMHERWAESLTAREQLATERAELRIAAEERRAENELRVAKEVDEIQRRNAIWTESLAIFKFGVPMLMQYLAGKAAGGAAHAAADSEYLRTVTDDQIETMRRRVPPEVLADFVARVKAARAADQPTAAAPSPATRSPAGLKRLEGDAKLGAAKLLATTLLPLVTERHLAGKPLIDPASDDLSLYQLLRRLAVSVNETEAQMVLGSLAPDAQAATLALLRLLDVELPGIGLRDDGSQP